MSDIDLCLHCSFTGRVHDKDCPAGNLVFFGLECKRVDDIFESFRSRFMYTHGRQPTQKECFYFGAAFVNEARSLAYNDSLAHRAYERAADYLVNEMIQDKCNEEVARVHRK